jgi:hypothetical protein
MPGALPFVRGVPEGQSARLPIIRADYRATLRGPGAKSRGTRHAPCRSSRRAHRRSARRVTGATPSGRPGPRATNSHKERAGAAPSKEDRWTAWRAPALAIPRHAGQRASEAQACGIGGWRAGVAADGTAAPGRAASQAGPAQKRKTPRSRASFRPYPSSRAMAAASVRSRRARPRTATSGAPFSLVLHRE